MFNNLKCDLRRYYLISGIKGKGLLRSKIYIMINSYGLHATAVYRFGKYIKKLKAGHLRNIGMVVYCILYKLVTLLYGIDINIDAEIQEGLYIGHLGGIHIGVCTIGANCSIHNQTRIGSLSKKENVPVIKNNVWIGPHSIIEGQIILGEGVTVAAGSYVKTNVKPHSLVMGNPSRIIMNNYDSANLLCLE